MQKKISIGLFIDTFYPMIDGVVMVVDNTAKRLCKFANVYVFAPKIPHKKFDDSKLPYHVIRCSSLEVPLIDYSLPVPKIDIKFRKILDSCHLDIVHIHSPATLGRIGVEYAKEHHIPIVGTMHSQYRQDIYRATKSNRLSDQLLKTVIHVYEQCDVCWAVNSEVARIFHEEYHYSKKPLVMNNATEMLPVKDVQKSRERINQLYDIKDEKVFLFVGRLNKLKNIFFIVDALKQVKISYKMLFVGEGQDEEQLKHKIKEAHLEKKIILCGRITDREYLADYYARSDLFLFPSLYDASSIVQIEAASQKTPCLFLKDAATACNIIDNQNGYLSENDVTLYAKKIDDIFQDQESYNKVCENAYLELYKNWDDEVKNIYHSYIDLIEREK